MPTYQFLCDEDDNGCGNLIEITCSFSDKQETCPKSCPKCRKRKPLRELFGSYAHIPKTLGSLADKKTSKMSEDEKHHLNTKHNDYKEKQKGESDWVSTENGLVHKSQMKG